jgi:hypothetical protein
VVVLDPPSQPLGDLILLFQVPRHAALVVAIQLVILPDETQVQDRKPVGTQRRSDLALIARTLDDEQEPIGNPRPVPLTCQGRGVPKLNIPVRVPHWRKVGARKSSARR